MKKNAGIIFRSLILLLLGIAIGMLISDDFTGRSMGLSFSGNDKISKVLTLVKNNYVDSVNQDSVEGVTVNSLLQNLDPHSMYLPPKQAESINERLEGGFNGIGLAYQLLRDTLIITQVYPDGPAAKAGLLPGDRVINVNGQKFSGTKLSDTRINNTFRGEKDTEIMLGVSAPGNPAIKPYTLNRGYAVSYTHLTLPTIYSV